mmetsp:Transcript_13070/g.22038  ORF Transcript_13070/g.22038 Transcript_13070/m.22038 type:complete len:168 (-) Transcript_13070:210-713(-)
MDKYRLVEEKVIGAPGFDRSSADAKPANTSTGGTMEDVCVVRITPQAKPRSCITTAMNILESGSNHVELRAMGKAINKAVTIAEILKRKMPLHQITTLSSCEIVNVYEPLEEGLDTVVNQHYVSCLTITLSRDLTGIDVNDKGYQPPLEIQPGQPVDYNTGKIVAAS